MDINSATRAAPERAAAMNPPAAVLRAAWTAPQALVHMNVVAGFEIVEFASRMVAAQIDFFNGLARCRSFDEAARLQARFAADNGLDCAREIANLADFTRENAAAVADTIDEPGGESL